MTTTVLVGATTNLTNGTVIVSGNLALALTFALDTDVEALFPPLDTTKFSIFYTFGQGDQNALSNLNRDTLYRVILTGGKTVPVLQYPSMVNACGLVRFMAHDPNNPYTITKGSPQSYKGITGAFFDNNSVYPYLDGYTYGPQLLNGADYGSGAFSSIMFIANEPMMVSAQSDRVDALYKCAAGESIVSCFTGPADNPYVALFIRTASTFLMRKFDTAWSRHAAPNLPQDASGLEIFDNNYYVVTGDINYNESGNDLLEFYNPPMKDATLNYFEPAADLILPLPALGSIGETPGFACIKGAANSGDIFTYGATDGSLVIVDCSQIEFSIKPPNNYIDAVSGAAVPSPINGTTTIDYATGLVYNAQNVSNLYLNSGIPLGQTTLASVLETLCLFAGFTADQVDFSNFNSIAVDGAVVNQTVGFAQLLGAIRDVFSIDIFDTNNQLNFVRKARGAHFSYDMIINEENLMPVQESSGANGITLLEYDRAYSGDLPVIQTLEYIDGDNLGTVGTQTARRTTFPVKTTGSDQTVDTSVPIIMGASDAIYWATAMLFDKWASSMTVKYRLGNEGFVVDPGDYHQIVKTDGTTLSLRVNKVALNADRSVSIEGTSLLQYDTFDAPQQQNPTIKPASIANPTAPLNGIFENILFQLADDDQAGAAPMRYTSDQRAGLHVYSATAATYVLVDTLKVGSSSGRLLTALPNVQVGGSLSLWEPDYKTTLRIVFKTPPVILKPTSDDAFRSGAGFLVAGAPGRWELVYFQNAAPVNGSSLLWTFSGLLRGRRGTDSVVGSSQTGDTVFFPSSINAMDLVYAPAASLNAGLACVLTPVPSANGVQTAVTVQPGATHAPWAPAAFSVARAASSTQPGRFDLTFTWQRRTRDETDTLHDGDATVTNEFGAEAYVFKVLSSGGFVIHTESALTASTFVYTAEAQITDGFASDPKLISARVAQIGNGQTGPFASTVFTFTQG